MRFRLTIFLLIANIALFISLWFFEREQETIAPKQAETVAFTTLEISGKSIDKPRVLKLENNKWRIVSPIDWPANLFAVNRIRNQLEFLDKETSFSLDEIKKHAHSLTEYGLDDPAFVFKYGNGEKMYALKIGKSAPIGDRIYMLDENGNRIIVVDKEFVEGLIVDMERLRNQSVFEIPRFEVSSFSIRLPIEGSDAAGKTAFRRIGLVKDAGKWKFETPIVATADAREVEAFLTEISQLSAKSFAVDPSENTGFDISALPTTITLEGTNRRQVLLLGGKTKDGSQIYARMEDNPTIFTLDADIFKNIGNIQTTLREKSFMRFDVNQTTGIDISKDGKNITFRKLKSGVWDVIGRSPDGKTLTANADLALVTALLAKLETVRARTFVNDAPGDGIASYGLGVASLHIVATQADQSTHGIVIGSDFKYGGATLMYASPDGSDAVYGISRELAQAAVIDFLHFRSRILESLPEKAIINSFKITDLSDNSVVFEIASTNGSFDTALKELQPRIADSARAIISECRRFTVENYLNSAFSEKGVVADGKTIPWAFALDVSVDLPGTSNNMLSEVKRWVFTKRIGGVTQYGGSQKADAEFSLTGTFINSLFNLTQERVQPKEINTQTPVPPTSK